MLRISHWQDPLEFLLHFNPTKAHLQSANMKFGTIAVVTLASTCLTAPVMHPKEENQKRQLTLANFQGGSGLDGMIELGDLDGRVVEGGFGKAADEATGKISLRDIYEDFLEVRSRLLHLIYGDGGTTKQDILKKRDGVYGIIEKRASVDGLLRAFQALKPVIAPIARDDRYGPNKRDTIDDNNEICNSLIHLILGDGGGMTQDSLEKKGCQALDFCRPCIFDCEKRAITEDEGLDKRDWLEDVITVIKHLQPFIAPIIFSP